MKFSAEQPPLEMGPYYKFYSESWDHEYARNALLHFIHENGLDKQCEEWLDEYFNVEQDD